MLNHTRKIKGIYEDIQKMLFYLIPEKWDKLFLYSSVIDKPNGEKTGELYFYYIPKGILKKKPVNVYEIPNRFNLDEEEYLKLIKVVFNKIKQLREEFRKTERNEIWSNMTITIQNSKFKVEYNYDDLEDSNFTNYERHIIWRYNYLGIGEAQLNKKDKEILNRYLNGAKTLSRKEVYEAGIYINNIKNIVDYNTEEENESSEENREDKEYVEHQKEEKKEQNKIRKNQLLLSEEEVRKIREKNKGGK